MARGVKFRILEVEGLYYPCSENKGADQLRGYREADLRLCFRICKNPVFSRRGSYDVNVFSILLMNPVAKHLSSGFQTRSDRNKAVQPKKIWVKTRNFRFRKRSCFRICKK